MVCSVERISHETALDSSCPSCGGADWRPALVRDNDGDLDVGAHCNDCLHSEVLP